MREGNPLEPNTKLCERMLSPYNLEVAVQNVKRNKGSAKPMAMGFSAGLEYHVMDGEEIGEARFDRRKGLHS